MLRNFGPSGLPSSLIGGLCRALGLIFYIFLKKRCFPTARPPPSLGVHVGSMCSSLGTRWRPLPAPWVSVVALWPPLAALGCPWPPLAASGRPWLPLAAPGWPWSPLAPGPWPPLALGSWTKSLLQCVTTFLCLQLSRVWDLALHLHMLS